MQKRTDYPPLPFIEYGEVLDKNGFYITLPFKGISLNDYKKMHFTKIARLKGQYKSVIDVVCANSVDQKYFKFENFDGNGLRLSKSVFNTQVDVEWILTFLKTNQRDPANYTQKILLDAIVSAGLLTDDKEKFVKSDKVMFGDKMVDSITCIIQSDSIDKSMFVDGQNKLYDAILSDLLVVPDRKVL